jgi:serine carboxypeptidase-like clade 1
MIEFRPVTHFYGFF